jgi:alpha 1,3-glucosidase
MDQRESFSRPQYVMFPKDQDGFDIDDQYFIGSSGLLVKPITEKDVTETTVYLAESQVVLSLSW